MKNTLIQLLSNVDGSEGQKIYVNAFFIQGITPGNAVYSLEGPYVKKRATGTGEQPIGQGARVYFSNDSHEVRESVAEVESKARAALLLSCEIAEQIAAAPKYKAALEQIANYRLGERYTDPKCIASAALKS